MDLHSRSVLKKGANPPKGPLNTLDYLLRFLGAYNFSAESSGGIQTEDKALIYASVLGLIFKKINGYKDGSFFTPGFITEYMARVTLRKAIADKFWNYLYPESPTSPTPPAGGRPISRPGDEISGRVREDSAAYGTSHPHPDSGELNHPSTRQRERERIIDIEIEPLPVYVPVKSRESDVIWC